MNTNETNTNDNGNPNDSSACELARRNAAMAILPALLSLLPLAVATRALGFAGELLRTLPKPETARSQLEAFEVSEAPTVRAAVDVVMVCVLGGSAVDAVNGAWAKLRVLDAYEAVQRAHKTVTGLHLGERDVDGPVTDVTALNMRERATAARRRGVLLAVFATVPENTRGAMLSGVEAWVRVMGGLATAAAASDNPTVREACETAAHETAATLVERSPYGKAHPDALAACSGVWFGVHPLLAGTDIATENAREVADHAAAAVEDLAHVRVLLSLAA